MAVPCPLVTAKDFEELLEDKLIQLRGEVRRRHGQLSCLEDVGTFKEASELVSDDETIWKISFVINGVRYRLIHQGGSSRWQNFPQAIDGEEETPIPDDLRRVLNEVGITV